MTYDKCSLYQTVDYKQKEIVSLKCVVFVKLSLNYSASSGLIALLDDIPPDITYGC